MAVHGHGPWCRSGVRCWPRWPCWPCATPWDARSWSCCAPPTCATRWTETAASRRSPSTTPSTIQEQESAAAQVAGQQGHLLLPKVRSQLPLRQPPVSACEGTDARRLEDLDRSGSRHGAVIVDPTDKRKLRGFVHLPSYPAMADLPEPEDGRQGPVLRGQRLEPRAHGRVAGVSNPVQCRHRWDHRTTNGSRLPKRTARRRSSSQGPISSRPR